MGRKAMRVLVLALAICLVNANMAFGDPAEYPGVARERLGNGLEVIIVRDALAPVVTTMVNYRVGSDEAPAGFPGMAHAQEHMMFRGSPGLSAQQLATLIAAMGGRFDADTRQTVTRYYFTVPSEDLEVALRIEAIRMRDVLDSEELWDQERRAIEQEVVQDLSNPMYVLYTKLLQHMFEGTPYAHDALGTRPSFDKTTGAMLKSFHDRWYGPNNAILVIAGDVDPQPALALVRRLFGEIPARPLPPRNPVDLKPLKAATIEQESDLPYGLAIVAYRLPGYDSPDFAAAQILVDVLSSERGGLYALVPAGKALDAGFTAQFLPRAGLGYAFAAAPPGQDLHALTAGIKAIIEGCVREGMPADLVEASKAHEIADAGFQMNSVAGMASAWADALALEGRQSPDDDVAAIRGILPADVDRAARAYLTNESAVVGLLQPRPAGKAESSHTFRGRESFAPARTRPVTLPEWARKAVAPPGAPVSHVSPVVTLLPNGLKLIVQRETVSPTVSVYGEVRHNADLQTPKGREGVDEVLDGLLSYGTTALDRIAFQKALDDIAARVSVGTGFELKVLAEHFDRGVELLAGNVLHPALPEPAFGIVRKETADMAAGRLKSPHYLSRRALLQALYPEGDPTLRQATPESVSSLTLEDVKRYHQVVFRPDLTVMVVIGDVTAEQAVSTIGKYFGGWEAAGPKPEIDLPAVPPNRTSETAVPDASRVQDAVILAQTLGLTRSHPDYYALQLGNHVLSGALYATRLYHDLREKAGLVYTVESALRADKTRSSFQVFYACDPPNVSKATRMIRRELRAMQESPVSGTELDQARALLVRQIPLSESSVDDIGERLLRLALLDLPLDEPLHAAKRYMSMTGGEVRAAYARWIRPEDFVQVTLGPKPD